MSHHGYGRRSMTGRPEPIPWSLVVFDCDGTLVDSQHAIVSTMAAAFEAAGLPAPDAAAVRRVVGLSLESAVARLLEGADGAPSADALDRQSQRLAELYRRAFHELRSDADYREPLFPGARDALAGLHALQVLLGIATGKGRRGLLATLESHGLADFFVTLQTADSAPGKPHPGMLERAMAETGSAPHDTVLVGDTVFDIEMARNAGVTAIGVSWGYHEAEELAAAGATRVIDSFSQLLPLLASLGEAPA